jgi:hypothetical protein
MLIHGLNFFVNFFALPEMNEEATKFSDQLEAAGLMAAAKVIEVVVGVMFLANIGVPAAIAMSMPVSIVIFFNNVIMVRGKLGYISGTVMLLVNVVLLCAYSGYFLSLLTLDSHVTGLGALAEWQRNWPVPGGY